MKRFLFAAALVLGLSTPALAQPNTAAFQATPSHRAAAEELLGLMNVERQFLLGLELAFEQQAETNPEVAEYEDVLRAFMAKYVSWEQLKPEFMDLYLQTYSEEEIRGLTAFYRTPLGQTVIQKEPELMAKASMIGQRRVQAHMPELMQMMMERMMADQANEGASSGTGKPGKPGTTRP